MKGVTQLFLTVIIWFLVFALVVGMCSKAAGSPSTGGGCWGPDQPTRNRIAQEKAAHDIEEDAKMRDVTRSVVRTVGYAFAALVLCGGGLLLCYGAYHAGQGAYKYYQGRATERRAVQVSLAVTKDEAKQLTTGTLHVQGVDPKSLSPAFTAMGASVAPSPPPLLSHREAEGLLRVALGSEYALLTGAQREAAIRRLLMAPSIEPLALGEGGEENAEIDSVVQRDQRTDSGK